MYVLSIHVILEFTGLVHELYYQLHVIALFNELYVVQLT
jgi:hypothetical protein